MTDLQSWVGPTYDGLADLLAAAPAGSRDVPLREHYADDRTELRRHQTFPARALTVEARGNFLSSPESRHTHAAPMGRTS